MPSPPPPVWVHIGRLREPATGTMREEAARGRRGSTMLRLTVRGGGTAPLGSGAAAPPGSVAVPPRNGAVLLGNGAGSGAGVEAAAAPGSARAALLEAVPEAESNSTCMTTGAAAPVATVVTALRRAGVPVAVEAVAVGGSPPAAVRGASATGRVKRSRPTGVAERINMK